MNREYNIKQQPLILKCIELEVNQTVILNNAHELV